MITFHKYSGAGNDFILIDNRAQVLPPASVPRLCHRQFGIGADGVLLWEDSQVADAKMVLYNRDGSRGEMCGNGLRCFAKFLGKATALIETDAGVYRATLVGNEVAIQMPPPSTCRFGIEVEGLTVDYLDTGVPHVVLFDGALEELGPKLRHHMAFAPRGANVNIATIHDKQTLSLRTFERGVEGETLACGTGATAAAFAARQRGCADTLSVHLLSGEILRLTFEPQGGVMMQGPAQLVFEGTLRLKPF